MKYFKKKIAEDVGKSTELEEKQVFSLLERPPDPKMGDFALPCFAFAKEFRKSPVEIAKELSTQIKSKLLDSSKPVGPYVNFFLNDEVVAELTLGEILKEKHTEKGRVLIEICSPNTNKPLHLGHLRNIFLGESVSLLYEKVGNEVVKTCIINDRGVHIAKSMLAYKKFGGDQPNKKTDHFVGDYYVLFNEKAQDNPELEEQAQELLRKWEAGDPDTRALWKKMNSWVYKGFQETYNKLDFDFDAKYYESEIYKKGKEIVEEGLKKGIFTKKEGAVVAELENMPDKIVLRSDGTSVYITQDLYLAEKRYDDYHPKKQIYVVASEQNLHFRQLFKILELLGRKWAKDCYHLSYGMVNLPDGRMKSREGTVVDADDIIAEMRELAKKEVEKRHADISNDELQERSRAIGDAALRFYILKIDPVKDMVYDPEESISFEGETGPYVQYTYARICSVLRKTNYKEIDYSLLKQDLEKRLVRMLADYREVVIDSAKQHKPSLLCRYLLDLCQLFNEYYHEHRILTGDELEKTRAALIDSVRQVIENGLGLLKIETLERM